MQQDVVWFAQHRWSFTFGIAFVCSGALISLTSVVAGTYGGIVAGLMILVFGAWVIWQPRNLSNRATAALARATINVEPGNPHPGDTVLCNLKIEPSRPIGLWGWGFSLSLMAPDDQEEEYRGEVSSAACRIEFEPRILAIEEEVRLSALLTLPTQTNTHESAGSQYDWLLKVSVNTTSPRSKLHSKAISFSTPANGGCPDTRLGA